ncbi:MAG TPA: hypothetical protein VN902_10280 [Candidatus Acidoferrales bacterium]|jgi:hypothetical protein|nr:hypothetical protein [Candidatus Acidoferrales bacterium]
MVAPPCPLCHGATRFAGNKPYCPHCGWNRNAALVDVRSGLNFIPVGIFLTGGFVFFMIHFWHFRNPYQIAIFIVFPAVGLLINYWVSRRSLARLQALEAPANRAASVPHNSLAPSPAATANSGGAVVEPSAQQRALLRTSRPREIRMATRGRISFPLALLGVLGFAAIFGLHLYTIWVRKHSIVFFTPGDWVIAAIVALLLFLPFTMWRSQVRECDLLENGEVALATVLRQWRGDKGSSSVEYEFEDFQGARHKGIGLDYTQKLFEGMLVAVFYDGDNPQRQIPACATYHEVVI